MKKIDHIDRKILQQLQKNADIPLNELANAVHLSPTPCWRRIQQLQEHGFIRQRVALLNPEQLNVGVTVFVALKTAQHNQAWLRRFAQSVRNIPEIVECYRMSGDVDYLLRIVVPDIKSYDAIYKKIIAQVELSDVSSSFAMEQIKYTTELPLDYA